MAAKQIPERVVRGLKPRVLCVMMLGVALELSGRYVHEPFGYAHAMQLRPQGGKKQGKKKNKKRNNSQQVNLSNERDLPVENEREP